MKIAPRPQMLIVLVMVGILMLLSCLTSCTGCSESGRRSVPTNQSILKSEKVVIIDAAESKISDDVAVTWYKIKRIDVGVVDYIRIVGGGKYESGDTILYRYPTR